MSQFEIKNDGSFLDQFMKLQSDPAKGGEATAADGQQHAAADQQQATGEAASDDPNAQYQNWGYDPNYYQQYQQYYQQYSQQYADPAYAGYSQGSYSGTGASAYGPSGGGGGGGGGGGRGPRNQSQTPTRSIWIGNVASDATEFDLRSKFAAFGMIENIKLLPQKNCAFINYMDVNSAITAFNSTGIMVRGVEVRIGWGKPDLGEPVQQRERDGEPSRILWIGNLSPEVDDERIRSEFSVYGHVDSVRGLPHKNCAFITMGSIDEARSARNYLQNKLLGDRPIRINFGRDEPQRDRGGGGGGGRYGDRGDRGDRGGGGGGYGDRGRSGYSRPGIGMDQGDSGASEGGGEPWAAAPAAPPPPPQVPNYAAPPESLEEKTVIDKMAEFVTRNGPQFELLMKEKEKNNPKLQFLFAGDSRFDYYKWKVYCLRNNLPSDVPLAPQKPGMTPQEREELEHILNSLSGTRESITSGRDWVIAHAHIAGDLIDRLYEATRQAHDTEKRLFLIYLINDSLLHSMKARKDPTVLDELSAVFQPKLVHILHLGLENQGPERKEKLLKILNYWEKRGVYDLSVITRMERILQGQEPLPPFPSSGPAYPQQQIPQQHQAPPQSSLPPWQQPPVYGGGAPPAASLPPWQSAPQQPPPPQQSSYTHSSPYGPTGSQHQQPPPPSSNMQSRLDEFYGDDDRQSKRHRSSGWDVADDGPNQRRRY